MKSFTLTISIIINAIFCWYNFMLDTTISKVIVVDDNYKNNTIQVNVGDIIQFKTSDTSVIPDVTDAKINTVIDNDILQELLPVITGQTVNKFFLVREKGTAVIASYTLYDNEVITESYKVRIIKAVK